METLTRLVSESLARHGFDRPLDYRRLQWSRWFRCESHHSLLFVPSKPGVFALAEEVMSLADDQPHVEASSTKRVETGTSPVPRSGTSGAYPETEASLRSTVEERRFSAASGAQDGALAAVSPRRMLAVTQFFEADDMAFVLDRMLSRAHVTHSRLESGRYFVRYVEIQDEAQRSNICNALNQWIVSSAEKATGIGSHFATSLEFTPTNDQTNVGRAPTRANADTDTFLKSSTEPVTNYSAQNSTPLEAVTATTVQRSPLFPSGF